MLEEQAHTQANPGSFTRKMTFSAQQTLNPQPENWHTLAPLSDRCVDLARKCSFNLKFCMLSLIKANELKSCADKTEMVVSLITQDRD